MTLITITTVGYGEVHPLSFCGRIFNSFLIFFGVTMMLLAVGGMTQVIIELELTQYFGKRRTRKMIDKLQDHIIVCGFGRVGRGAAHELQRAGVPFLIVDKSEDRVEWAMRDGMLAVLADATDDETLKHAGVLRAKGLIATLQSDADNLFVILSAKALKPTLQVSARVASEQSEKKMRLAGADYVFAPYDMTGNRMAQVMLKPHVFQFIDFTTKGMGLDVGIEQFSVPASSEFASKSLAESKIRKELGVIVLAIRKSDGRMLFNPPAEAEIEAGDYLIVMGEAANLQQAGAAAGRGARVKVLTAAQMRDVDRRTAELGIPEHHSDGECRASRGRVSGTRVCAARGAAHRGGVRQGQQWRRWVGCGAAALSRVSNRSGCASCWQAIRTDAGRCAGELQDAGGRGLPRVSGDHARDADGDAGHRRGAGNWPRRAGQRESGRVDRAINRDFPLADVVAVDVPSGAASDSGDFPARRWCSAKHTVTFTALKPCLVFAARLRIGWQSPCRARLEARRSLYENDEDHARASPSRRILRGCSGRAQAIRTKACMATCW